MSKSQKQILGVGGIQLNIFSPSPDPDPGRATSRVAVLFFLHGRLSKADNLEVTATKLVEKSEDRRRSTADGATLKLMVVTFDLRNHGARIANPQGNQEWSRKAKENNPRHAIDMFGMISGTYRDISFLIDFLPSYLYPYGEQTVERWMLAGISLGGHATWYALQHEPRLSVGIPIIGCPDYLALMHNRAEASGLQFGPPILPDSLLELIKKESPVCTPVEGKNPFFGKKILVLAGGKDELVPWVFSESFVERIETGEEGVKKVVVYPDVGHEFTATMEENVVDFVWEEGCQPIGMDFDPDTHPVRITTGGKIKTWVQFALDFLDENEERSLTFHTLPPPGTPPGAKTSTETIPRLISVVEIVKREHLERLKARRSSSLAGLHQYNELGALQDLPSPPVPSPDVTEILSGSNVKIKKTVFMKVTLSRKELRHLADRGATYQPPLVRTLSKSAKARARNKKRKAAAIVESMTVEM